MTNLMREIKIEKVLLSAGGKGSDLAKAKKLLEILSGKKAQIIASKRRIPSFGVSPGVEVGTRVTLRKEEALAILKRFLGAIENILNRKSVSKNHFSFGLKEYIDIPGTEYQRDIGIRGLNITVVFSRAGFRIKRKKIKRGNLPERQLISEEEIIKFMEDNFKTKFR